MYGPTVRLVTYLLSLLQPTTRVYFTALNYFAAACDDREEPWFYLNEEQQDLFVADW